MILIHKETAEIIEYKPLTMEMDFTTGRCCIEQRFFMDENLEIPFDDLEDVTNFISNFEILGWI